MNNDGEDVREYLCDLCQSEPAIEGERHCRSCKGMHDEEVPPPEVEQEPTESRDDGAGSSPRFNRDCGRWLP